MFSLSETFDTNVKCGSCRKVRVEQFSLKNISHVLSRSESVTGKL